jgi:hypothetical protein
LEPYNEGWRDDPGLVVLRSVVESPEIDDDLIKDVDVAWSGAERGVKIVEIRMPNGEEGITLDVGVASRS